MTNTCKQIKITTLFRRGVVTRLPDECDGLQVEIQQLEQILTEKQNVLFEHQRNSHRRKPSAVKKKSELFVRPEKIVLTNSVDRLKRDIQLMSRLSGLEVQSYVADDHCAIVYHMQHNSEHELKHGLRIDMKNGDKQVSKSSLPLGFNLAAVLDGFENLMLPECLVGVEKALVAYYERLEQFSLLKKMLIMEAQLFKILDGSHIEISFTAKNENDPDESQIAVTLILDYRVYDIRPKQYTFVEIDMPEGSVDILKDQCAVFKKKPLHKAFKEAFIEGNGAYVMVQQVGPQPVEQRKRRKRFHPTNLHNNIDDTFHPEDCSESEDEVDH